MNQYFCEIMNKILILLLLAIVYSCNSNTKTEGEPDYNDSLEKIENGMTFKEVESITGIANKVEDLGKSETETGDTTHLIQWFYGTNQSIMFTNGKVSGIDLDMKASSERIQHIIDSAKAADGTSGGIQIQPQQQ